MHNQGVVGWPTFGAEDPGNRLVVAGISSKPIDGLCRQRHALPLQEHLRGFSNPVSASKYKHLCNSRVRLLCL